MTTEKIISVVGMYEQQFRQRNIPKIRMNTSRTLGSLTSEERLAHAHFLIDGIRINVGNSKRLGKVNRHLASVQMILSFENWYTLEELMSHNHSD
jgi:hypothetical protein